MSNEELTKKSHGLQSAWYFFRKNGYDGYNNADILRKVIEEVAFYGFFEKLYNKNK